MPRSKAQKTIRFPSLPFVEESRAYEKSTSESLDYKDDEENYVRLMFSVLLANPEALRERDPEAFRWIAITLLLEEASRASLLDSFPVSKEKEIHQTRASNIALKVDRGGLMSLDDSELVIALSSRLVLEAVCHSLDRLSEEGAGESISTFESGIPVPPIPTSEYGSPDLIARGCHKWSGEALERLVRFGKGPRPSSARMELVGLFLPSSDRGASQEPKGSTCIAALWQFSLGTSRFSGYCLDEMALFLVRGSLIVHFDGAPSVVLHAGRSRKALMWMSGSPTGIAGLPPVTIEATGDTPPLAMVLLYNRDGVPYNVLSSGCIEVEGEPKWTEARKSEYWQSIDRHVHQMMGRRPFRVQLPSARQRLGALPARNMNGYEHQMAVVHGQLDPRVLHGWPEGANRKFRNSEDIKHGVGRKEPMLDFCMLRLLATGSRVSLEQVSLAKHPGCSEVLIPIVGASRSLVVEAGASDANETTLAAMGDEKRIKHSDIIGVGHHNRAVLPDLLVCNSAFHHGFTSSGRKDAYALLVRCYDYNFDRPSRHATDVSYSRNIRRVRRSGSL